jgi:hypothetical protein
VTDTLLEPLRILILFSMLLAAAGAILLSLALARRTDPLEEQLQTLHRRPILNGNLHPLLREIEDRYTTLLGNVDSIDTAEFSAGEVETLIITHSPLRITAAAAQSWIRQAPGILISLGLLGTFAGLTVGLRRISTVLGTQDIESLANGLGRIVEPMGTAFETSLLGLFLSLIVLIMTQLNGTRSCLERCEALLSSWLETVLPQRLGEKLSTPLRTTLDRLNNTIKGLPDGVSQAVSAAMQEAFRSKLDAMVDTSSLLAEESHQAVRQLTAMAACLSESGQDFIEAARAFHDSDFATTLNDAVLSMAASSQSLTSHSESLACRLADVRDGLITTQAEWQLLAAAAQTELATSRTASEMLGQEAAGLREFGGRLSRLLREIRAERKLALELADSVQSRLASDQSMAESCTVFSNALGLALSNWSRNVERLDQLAAETINQLAQTRTDHDEHLARWKREVDSALTKIRTDIEKDLSLAIDNQRKALQSITPSAQEARDQCLTLLRLIDELSAKHYPNLEE